MNKKILILGSNLDVHITSVVKHLDKLNINYHIISHNKSYDYNIFQQENSLNIPILDDVSLIWNRIKLSLPLKGHGEEYEQEYMVKAAWLDFYSFLISSCKEKNSNFIVLNIPFIGFSSKITCLNLANRSGFRTPVTIIPSNL